MKKKTIIFNFFDDNIYCAGKSDFLDPSQFDSFIQSSHQEYMSEQKLV